MIGALPITIACTDTDRTRAIIDGQVQIEGCAPTFLSIEPAEIFFRALRYQEFDVAELSLSSFLRTIDRGEATYVAIPAFLARMFRHSSIYIRTDRGIQSPADLRGRRIGVPEYQMTAPVWMRALLQHEYGVPPSDVQWLSGGQEEPGRTERTELGVIKGVSLEPIPAGKTLSGMLAAGELDALFAARTPSCFTRGAKNVGRLFPDYKKVEQDYYRKTGLFPIMHLVGVRKELADRYPWLPASVYKAFCETKAAALKRLRQVRFLPVSVPWLEPDVAETTALMGDDYWKYGVTENLTELKAFIQYSYEQGLISRPMDVGELFAASTIETSKV